MVPPPVLIRWSRPRLTVSIGLILASSAGLIALGASGTEFSEDGRNGWAGAIFNSLIISGVGWGMLLPGLALLVPAALQMWRWRDQVAFTWIHYANRLQLHPSVRRFDGRWDQIAVIVVYRPIWFGRLGVKGAPVLRFDFAPEGGRALRPATFHHLDFKDMAMIHFLSVVAGQGRLQDHR